MKRTGKSRLGAAIAVVLPLAMLAALFLVLTAGSGAGKRAQAAVEPGLDFSLAVASLCESTAGPTTCAVASGGTFTVDFKANAIGSLSAGGYGGYDMDVTFSGDVTYNTGSLQQTGAGVWPGCVFATAEAAFTSGENYTACSIGAGAPNSTYTGVMLKMGFTCGASGSGTITLVVGDGRTDLVDSSFVSYTEAANESLSISCGVGGTPQPTQAATNTPPPGATATNTGPPQPTATHGPPTATPTPGGHRGDVNGDGRSDSLDALWVLWQEAHIIAHVPLPENADVNHDGRIDALDALFILWIAAGRNV